MPPDEIPETWQYITTDTDSEEMGEADSLTPSWEHPDPSVRFRLLEAALGISGENLEAVCTETGTCRVDSELLLDSLVECAGKTPRWHAAAMKYHSRLDRVQRATSDIILEQERQAADTHRASQSLFRPGLAEFD